MLGGSLPVLGSLLVGQKLYLLNLVTANIHLQRRRTDIAVDTLAQFGGVDNIGSILLDHHIVVLLGTGKQYHSHKGGANCNLLHIFNA